MLTQAGIERAALRLFVTRGLRGTTVRDIAAQAGGAEGTLYRHWRSKQYLARSVWCSSTSSSSSRRAARLLYPRDESSGLLGSLEPGRLRRRSA